MVDTPDIPPEFDPTSVLDDDEKARFGKMKDDPQFAQMCSDINLIRKIQNGLSAHKAEQEKKLNPPKKKDGLLDWAFSDNES